MTSAGGAEVAVTGPFLACVSTEGEETLCSLAELPLDLLRRCSPVRRPNRLSAPAPHAGHWFSTTAACFLEYESLLERDWMTLMDFDREVEAICEQPLRLDFSRDGRSASHFPDLLVWRHGRPELCDVKSEERVGAASSSHCASAR